MLTWGHWNAAGVLEDFADVRGTYKKTDKLKMLGYLQEKSLGSSFMRILLGFLKHFQAS